MHTEIRKLHTEISFLTSPHQTTLAFYLQEMECDDSKLYSMFLREFSGTVTKANPAYVETRLHGQVRMTSATEYPYPSTSDRTKHKGDLKHLKVLAGMRISMYNQVRTVVRDISATKSAIELLSNTEVRKREARERERQADRWTVGQLENPAHLLLLIPKKHLQLCLPDML